MRRVGFVGVGAAAKIQGQGAGKPQRFAALGLSMYPLRPRSLLCHRADYVNALLRVHRYPDNLRALLSTRWVSRPAVDLASPYHAVSGAQHPSRTGAESAKLAPRSRCGSPPGGRRQGAQIHRTAAGRTTLPCWRPARAASASCALVGLLARYRTGREVWARLAGCASPRRAGGGRRGRCADPARPCFARPGRSGLVISRITGRAQVRAGA